MDEHKSTASPMDAVESLSAAVDRARQDHAAAGGRIDYLACRVAEGEGTSPPPTVQPAQGIAWWYDIVDAACMCRAGEPLCTLHQMHHDWGEDRCDILSERDALLARCAALEAQAAFGAKVLDTFSEYWGDVDGGDLQDWAIATGCIVGHVKQPLPYADASVQWEDGTNGLCNGQPCSGETEPGDTCYHLNTTLGGAAPENGGTA